MELIDVYSKNSTKEVLDLDELLLEERLDMIEVERKDNLFIIGLKYENLNLNKSVGNLSKQFYTVENFRSRVVKLLLKLLRLVAEKLASE